MKNIYFTSDTHWGHSNIVRGTTKWDGNLDRCRDFDTLEEHNEALITSINSVVKENDILYHLGDWSFGGDENIKLFRNALKCKEIHLVTGNHDQHITPSNSPYRGCFNSVQQELQFSLKLGTEKTGKYGKQMFFLSHYGHRVWNNSHHGSIHLFGHSHGTLPMWGKSMDVGVDTNGLYPYHLDEILDIMKNVDVKIIDHHTSEIN